MKQTMIVAAIVVALALAGAATVWFWLGQDPTASFTVFEPGMDGRAAALTNVPRVVIGEFFTNLGGKAETDISGSWPRFRGPHADNSAADSGRLADSWPKGGPRVLWSLDLGEGHAGPAVANGRVYVLDYDEAKKSDALRCFSLGTGAELWRRWYRTNLKRNHGFSRTVPAVSSNYVVTIGPNCQVMCVKADSGEFVWGIDLVREYGTKVPGWYTGQCPLIDNGLAIIAPAGSNTLMIAVECATGKVVWHTPNPRAWPMSHSSIMPVTLGGVRMFVYAASGGLAGIAADGPRRGMILWETNAFNHAVVAPSPVCMPDGKVFIAAGYAAGGMMLEVRMTNGGYTVAVLETLPPGKGLATEQQTPVFLNGLLYAVMPKDGGQHRNEFVCCAPDTCGTFVWTSGTGARFGLGPYIAADGKLFILDDEGELTMVRASAERWEPLGRAHVLAGKEAWGPMAIVSGRLLARDEKRMVCLDISAQ